MEKTIKTQIEYRQATIDRAAIDDEKRTVELSFSSEEPYDRYFGTEILDHGKKSVDLKRLNNGGPLLLDHNRGDQVGVIEKAFVGGDRKGRALVRFGKSGRADEVFNDVIDGIRQNVSVAYAIHKMRQEDSDPDKPIFRATRWEPMEVSIVSVPADITVGVGRSDKGQKYETIIENPSEGKAMETKEKDKQKGPEVKVETREVKVIDEDKIADARQSEQNRVRELLAYGKKLNCEAEAMKAIEDGTTVDQFRVAFMDKLPEAQRVETKPEIGLGEKELQKYSFLRALNAMANPKNQAIQDAAGLEIEASKAFADKVKREPRGLFVPNDVLRHKRDLTVGTDSAGGYLVATNLLAANFIELLRNRMMTQVAGATVLRDLIGDVAIPKQSGGATAYWVAESGAPTESQQTVAQVGLAPKTVGAFTDISRKLLLQSSIDVENFVRMDLTRVLALAMDLAALHGTGSSNQPTGIAATSGIGAVTGGTNGAAPDWADIVNLETAVAQDNADIGRLAYMTNAKVRGKLKQTEKASNTAQFVWENTQIPGVGELNGYPAFVTNQVSSALTKGTSSGVCSAIFFGNWADLIIGLWSGIDLLVDPYTGSSTGTVRVTAFQDGDIAVRHVESFAAMLDALTT
jgi:HK97 family phage major capsid protein